jgi:hypothetical protein
VMRREHLAVWHQVGMNLDGSAPPGLIS